MANTSTHPNTRPSVPSSLPNSEGFGNLESRVKTLEIKPELQEALREATKETFTDD